LPNITPERVISEVYKALHARVVFFIEEYMTVKKMSKKIWWYV